MLPTPPPLPSLSRTWPHPQIERQIDYHLLHIAMHRTPAWCRGRIRSGNCSRNGQIGAEQLLHALLRYFGAVRKLVTCTRTEDSRGELSSAIHNCCQSRTHRLQHSGRCQPSARCPQALAASCPRTRSTTCPHAPAPTGAGDRSVGLPRGWAAVGGRVCVCAVRREAVKCVLSVSAACVYVFAAGFVGGQNQS